MHDAVYVPDCSGSAGGGDNSFEYSYVHLYSVCFAGGIRVLYYLEDEWNKKKAQYNKACKPWPGTQTGGCLSAKKSDAGNVSG